MSRLGITVYVLWCSEVDVNRIDVKEKMPNCFNMEGLLCLQRISV